MRLKLLQIESFKNKKKATGHLIGKKIGDKKIDRFKQTTKIRC